MILNNFLNQPLVKQPKLVCFLMFTFKRLEDFYNICVKKGLTIL